MARIRYLAQDEISDPEMRQWLEEAIQKGTPGPENQAIRAHHKPVMRNVTTFMKDLQREGLLEPELRELIRARVSTSWEKMLVSACSGGPSP